MENREQGPLALRIEECGFGIEFNGIFDWSREKIQDTGSTHFGFWISDLGFKDTAKNMEQRVKVRKLEKNDKDL